MAFFDNLAKKVSKGLDQASFEAEKLVRVNKLKSELGALQKELMESKAALGDKVMELNEAGSLSMPELEDSIKAVMVLVGRVELQEKELAATQEETYQAKAGELAPEEGGEPAEGAGASCPGCGAELLEGAVFCANCGAKVE